MSTTASKPATTPIPGQLSAPECTALILPHLSRPQRRPKGNLGSYRGFNLTLWVLSTGRHWNCWPVPHDSRGNPASHDRTVDKVCARWADDGSLWQACIARVAHLAAAQQLALRVLHGDGTNTVAQKGGMALGIRGTNTRVVSLIFLDEVLPIRYIFS